MQFKFKIQHYQTEAARAVVDVFEGRAKSALLLFRTYSSDTVRRVI